MDNRKGKNDERDVAGTSPVNTGLFGVAVDGYWSWIQTSMGLEKVSHLSRLELMCLHPRL